MVRTSVIRDIDRLVCLKACVEHTVALWPANARLNPLRSRTHHTLGPIAERVHIHVYWVQYGFLLLCNWRDHVCTRACLFATAVSAGIVTNDLPCVPEQ